MDGGKGSCFQTSWKPEMAVNALQKMSDLRITCMPVLDETGTVTGSVLMQDIFKAGIVR